MDDDRIVEMAEVVTAAAAEEEGSDGATISIPLPNNTLCNPSNTSLFASGCPTNEEYMIGLMICGLLSLSITLLMGSYITVILLPLCSDVLAVLVLVVFRLPANPPTTRDCSCPPFPP